MSEGFVSKKLCNQTATHRRQFSIVNQASNHGGLTAPGFGRELGEGTVLR
jgi:hypothetical protein